jgi:hypothetical protein
MTGSDGERIPEVLARIDELDLTPGRYPRDEHRPITDYPRMPERTCYLSSRILVECYPELDVVYGKLTWFHGDAGVTWDHAWNVTPDGRVVDSTWTAPPGASDITYWPDGETRQGRERLR